MTTMNKRIAKVLRDAAPYLNTGKHIHEGDRARCICFAIDKGIFASTLNDNVAGVHICREISIRLGDSATMAEWLIKQGIPEYQLTHNRVQAHRHAWLQQLIEEFDNK